MLAVVLLSALSLVAEIKVKILSTSKNKDASLATPEKLLEDLDLEELQYTREGDTMTSAEVTKTARTLADSMTKLLEDLLVRHKLLWSTRLVVATGMPVRASIPRLSR